ncbi:hypothetical protein J4E81_008899 [Alternaria sp. BMP 2799]|nr:hypothetical protein J4E81_008899 [Alternaria sp. BMP 2799]
MMKEYNNKQQPEWKYKINLNTIIAILSTLMRACLVFVAEEVIVFSVGIGPFTQQAIEAVPCDRPLKAAEANIRIARYMTNNKVVRFDSAYMEPDISTKIALVRGLADPNGTSSDITPDCSTGNCDFPSYQGVTHSSIAICKKCVDVTSLISEAVNMDTSWFAGANDSRVPTPVEDFVLPDGHNIGGGLIANPPRNIMDVYGSAGVWKFQLVRQNNSVFDTFDESFDDILRASIVNVSVLAFTTKNPVNDCDPGTGRCLKHSFNTSNVWLKDLDAVATACSLYPCVQDYHGSVRDTIFVEDVVKETPMVQPQGEVHPFLPWVHFHTPCLIDGQVYTLDNISSVPRDRHNFTTEFLDQGNITYPTECAYMIDGAYARSFTDFMTETLFGNCTAPPRINFNGDSDDWNTLSCDPWYLKGLANMGNATFQSIDRNVESIAVTITNAMRTQGTGLNMSLPNETIPIYAKGTVIQTTVCIKFNWVWLIFPISLTVLSVVLICTSCGKMYFDTQEIPAWKSSVLPLLLTGNQVGVVASAEDMDKIKANTNNLVVSLAHLERGWEFVVESREEKKRK